MESKDLVANRTWKEWAQVQCNYLVRTRHLAKGIVLFWRPLVGVTDLHLILKYKLLAKSSQKNNVRVSFRALREQRHTHCLFLCSVAEVSKQKKEMCLLLTIEFFSNSSANTFLHCSLHLFCKDYIDPTHRDDTTPLQAGLSINIPSLHIQHVPYFLC